MCRSISGSTTYRVGLVCLILLAGCCTVACAGLIGAGDFVIYGAGRFPDVAYGSQSQKYLVAILYNGATCRLVNNDGTLSGSAFTVQDPGTGVMFPAVAYNSTNNEFIVTWDTWGRAGDIYGQRVNAATGALVGGNFPIATVAAAQRSAVAWSPAGACYYVVYSNFADVYGQRISATGAKIGSELNITSDPAFSGYPAVCYGSSGNQFLVAWDGDYGIQARRVDAATGNLLGSVIQVGVGDRPCIAYDTINNRWLVQYCQTVGPRFQENRNQYGRLINPDGSLYGGAIPIFNTAAYETESNFGADICFIPGKGGRFYSSSPVCSTYNMMGGQELDTSGSLIGGQICLTVNHGGGNNNAADTDLNRYLAVYEDPENSACIRGRLYAAGDPPSPVTNLTAVPSYKQNSLSWTNPSDADYTGTIIRCNSTSYPSNPCDGMQVCTRSTAPGGNDGFLHTGLRNYATYYYCAWAYDANGDYALVTQTTGMPIGLPDAPIVTQPANNSVVDLSEVDPIGTTVISWDGDPQNAYQVRLTQDNDPNTVTNGWDSGQVSSTSVAINSPVLPDATSYYVFVRIRNPHGWSPWSANGHRFTTRLAGSESFVYHADALPTASGWQIYDTSSLENGGGITSQIIKDGGSQVWRLVDGSTVNRCKERRSVSDVSFDTGASLAARVAVPSISGTQGYNLGISNGNVGGLFMRLSTNQVSLVDINGSVKASSSLDATPYHTYYLTVQNATPGNNNTAFWRVYVDGCEAMTWTGAGLENGFDGFMAGNSGASGTGTWKFDWIAGRRDGAFGPSAWSPVGSHDHYAPSPVSNFTGVPGTGQVTLSWTNPGEPCFTGTLIRYKTGGYPTGPTDGALVVDKAASPGSNDNFIHTGLVGTTYYYAAFAHNSFPDYSAWTRTSATPDALPQVSNFTATAGVGNVTLSWTNPADPWFVGTMIRYRTNTYPTGSADGSLVCDRNAAPGSNDSFIHSGLGNATYYYAAYAHDGTPVYAGGVFASAVPGCIAVWLQETFDGYTNGNLGGQGAWTTTGPASAQVQSAFAKGGTGKSVLMDTIASGATIGNRISFDAKSAGYHYATLDVAQDTAGTTGQLAGYVSFLASDLTEIAKLIVQKGRLLMEYGSGSQAILTTSATNLTWYTVKVGFDIQARKFDLWLDGNTKGANYAWKGSGNNLASIDIGSVRNAALNPQKIYIDNLTGEVKPTTVTGLADDGAWTPSLSKLRFAFDPAQCAGEYQYSIGIVPNGTSIRGWTSCQQATDVVATGLSLADNQNCYVNVRVGTGLGTWGDAVSSNGIKVAPGVGIQQAKGLPNGGANDVKSIRGKVVTATFPGYFYVQEPGGYAGIRILSSAAPNAGDEIDVCGVMSGSGAERYLDATGKPSFTTTPGSGVPGAIAMSAASVGGAALNVYTPGVLYGLGPNNIGLLVTVFGKVTAVGSGFFYLDDGSGVTDPRINPATGQPYVGLKVFSSEPAGLDEYWRATGVIGAEVEVADIIRVILCSDAGKLGP